jgi:hypothetical protein
MRRDYTVGDNVPSPADERFPGPIAMTAPPRDSDETAAAARRAKRIVLGIYLVFAGAFILSSAWQITAAVFGLR